MSSAPEKSGRAISWGSLLAAIVAGFALGGLFVYFFPAESLEKITKLWQAKTTTDIAETQKSAKSEQEKVEIPGLGHIEPKDGILTLGVAAPDRIVRFEEKVNEGNEVKQGDKLVILESETMRRLEMESIKLQRTEAKERRKILAESGDTQIQIEQNRLEQLQEISPRDIAAQQIKIDSLSLQEANAKRDYDRLINTGDTIAEQDREKQKLLWEQSQKELAAANEQLKRMKAAYPLDRKMALARIEAAKAEKQRSLSTISSDESLENQVKQAEARYKEAQVIAPTDGTILRLLAHEGELVQGKPILQMANLKEMIVVAEISVDFRPLIKEGDQAEITSKVFKEPEKEDKKEQCLGKLEGEVYTIEDMVGKPQVANPDPLAPSDKRIVQVKIKLTKKEQNALAAKYIGHEVKVKIVKPKQQKNGPK